ncbi:Uncharacterised protein [Vibrio cholerae]|nr:Uncharacterised protein [Vibrio cholerae]
MCFMYRLASFQHADIRTRNKVIRLKRVDNQPFDLSSFFIERCKNGLHLFCKCRLQGIHFFARDINRQPSVMLLIKRELKCIVVIHYSTSRIIAAPKPPAAQAVFKAKPPPRRFNSRKV